MIMGSGPAGPKGMARPCSGALYEVLWVWAWEGSSGDVFLSLTLLIWF